MTKASSCVNPVWVDPVDMGRVSGSYRLQNLNLFELEKRIRVVKQRSKGDSDWVRINIQRGRGNRPLANPYPLKDSDGKRIRSAAVASELFWKDFSEQITHDTPQRQKLSEIAALLRQGKNVELGCCGDPYCHGHRIRNELVSNHQKWVTLDDRISWLSDQLNPALEESGWQPPHILELDGWIEAAHQLLEKHWGDFDAFAEKELEVDNDWGITVLRSQPGIAASQAGHLLMQWDFLDRSSNNGEVDLLMLYRLKFALEDHVDPDRTIANYLREKVRPDFQPYPPVTEAEPLEDFKACLEHHRKKWGFCYKVKFNKYGREVSERTYLSPQESLARHRNNEKEAAGDQGQSVGIAPLSSYSELREAIFRAASSGDEDQYNAGLGEMVQRFRKDERKLLPELLRMLRTKYSKRTFRTGEIDIRKVKQLDYALEGFLPKGEVVHLFAPWFGGKTSLCVGMAAALIRGTGFLDYDIGNAPRSCLFIQTDAGASRFQVELDKQGLLDDPRFVPGAEQMLTIWAPDDEQGVEAWSATFKGLVKLREAAEKHKFGAIFIDSVKGMMSGTGMNYTDNETVNQFVTLLRQTVAQPLDISVVLINHKGMDRKEGAGAKAWSEACGQVIELARIEREGQEMANVRELIIRKDSLTGPRSFHYKMEDGLLMTVMATDVIKDSKDLVLQTLRKLKLENGATQFVRKSLLGIDGPFGGSVSPASMDRALKALSRQGGPLKCLGRGKYALKDD